MLVLYAHPGAAQAARAAPHLSVTGSWMRAIGGPAPAAAYFSLVNGSNKAAVLVGASSPACATLTMHQSRNVGGVESMTAVARRVVPAQGKVDFAPGGYHLMCTSPSKGVKPGAKVPIALRFADGERVHVMFPVRALGAAPQ